MDIFGTVRPNMDILRAVSASLAQALAWTLSSAAVTRRMSVWQVRQNRSLGTLRACDIYYSITGLDKTPTLVV